MQPCHVCGSMTVNAAGYCAGCGVYRGVPVSTPPYSTPPYSYPPAPPAPTRSPFMVPLIALSCVLVVLVVAVVVVLSLRSGKDKPPNPPVAGSAAPSPLIDSCLIGTWRASTDNEQIDIPDVGPVTLAGRGMVLRIHPDGTMRQEYDSATPYTATVNGHQLSIRATGTISGTIRTDSGTISFHSMTADGTITMSVDGGSATATPLSASSDPVRYTCIGDTISEHTDRDNLELTRTSSTP